MTATACSLSLGVGFYMGSGSSHRAPASTPAVRKTEIKLELSPSDLPRLLEALELSKKEKSKPRERRIYFFDTPTLELYRSGIILRARLESDSDGDSTVKVRTPEEQLGRFAEFEDTKGFKCEWDQAVFRSPENSGKLHCSLSKDQSALAFAHGLVARDRPLSSLYTSKQLDFLNQSASLPIAWENLKILGPVQSTTWESEESSFGRALTVELWEIAGSGVRILELSLKVDSEESSDDSQKILRWIHERGLKPLDSGRSKTQWVLERLTVSP